MKKTDIIRCLQKRKKRLKDIKIIIARLKNSLNNDKMHFKIAITKIFFVCSFINFLKKNGVLKIIIIKALNVWPHLSIHKAFIILFIKTPFYILHINQ